MNTKQELRKQIQELFLQQNSNILTCQNKNITVRVLQIIRDGKYKKICIYENMIDEVETQKLIHTLRSEKIQIYTPQVIGEHEMILIDEEYEHYDKEIDLFIVPGRAFSQDGKRLGRGKGYYDRFLSQKKYKKSRKIGMCFDFQLLENIPVEKHDIVMNKIITFTAG